jgi:hypothetical protein
MGVINFKKPLSVAVVLQWKGEMVPDALSDILKDHRYVIANESVTEFTITASLKGTETKITRKAKKGARFYNDKLNTFTTAKVSGKALDKLLAPGATPTFAVDLTFTYRTFFDVLLKEMTRTDAGFHNVANPEDSATILGTFTHGINKKKVSISYNSATEQITSLPCKLVDKQVKKKGKGKAPAVKLVFELDFLTGVDALRRTMMRKLVAMDWSKLARYGAPRQPPSKTVSVWRRNVYAYLLNHTDVMRGLSIRSEILGRHSDKTPDKLATDLRNDIDVHIITANHWGQAREDLKTERHQRLLSDLFGTIHQSAWLASPVSFIRDFDHDFKLTLDQRVALTLQYATGHCGEHADTSHSILRDVVETPGSKVEFTVLTGNANIDHAFVIYNMEVEDIIQTKSAKANNTRTKGKGKELFVFNLRDAISKNAPRKGFVLDPYLDTSVVKPEVTKLLESLHSKRRRNAGKDTDFLAWLDQYPTSPDVKDIRGKSEERRLELVKNV